MTRLLGSVKLNTNFLSVLFLIGLLSEDLQYLKGIFTLLIAFFSAVSWIKCKNLQSVFIHEIFKIPFWFYFAQIYHFGNDFYDVRKP